MQIKRFEAKDMTEALRMVKKEFGDDAVILSAKSMTKSSRILGAIKKTGVVITAATDQAVKSSKTLNRLLKENKNKAALPVKEERLENKEKQGIFKPLYSNFSKSFLKRSKDLPPQIKRDDSTSDHPGIQNSNPKMVAYLEALFRYHQVAPNIVMDIITDIKGAPGLKDISHPDEMKPLLVSCLKKRMVSTPDLPHGNGRRILSFVGGFGAGKTTTLVKLAARHSTLMNHTVGVISLDHYRVGNVAVLKSYAEILGVHAFFVSGKEELNSALDELQGADVVFIDTPGISLTSEEEIKTVSELLSHAKPDETHLLLNVSTKNDDLERSLKAYQAFSPTHLLFTRIDESHTYGNMLNRVIQSKLPISYVSTGVNIPEDIESMTLEKIGDLLFSNSLQYSKISHSAPSEPSNVKDIKDVQDAKEVKEVNPLKESPFKPEGEYYVANRNSDIFHHKACQSVKRIHPEHITYFKNMDEAMDKAFKPCRMCCHVKVNQKLSNQPIRQNVRSRHY